MGVKRLTTFIKLNKNIFLTNYELQNTKVIIDGANLIYILYQYYDIPYEYGGDYDEYARRCKQFINTLRDANVEPFIVFDGGHDPDDRKLPTILHRKRQIFARVKQGSGSIKPILCNEIFRKVLVELGVAHISCVYEADREIAVLAKKWGCPVISNDSDFFIYALEGGFIPADFLMGRPATSGENGQKYLPVKYYHYQKFQEYCLTKGFLFDKVYILPMLATLMGNDYTEEADLEQFFTDHDILYNPRRKFLSDQVAAILRWLTATRSEEDAVNRVMASVDKERRSATRTCVQLSIHDYTEIDEFESFNLEEALFNRYDQIFDGNGTSGLADKYGRKVPDWFAKKMINSELGIGYLQEAAIVHRVFFNCQIELLPEKSSYACSRDLRAIIYGIIFKDGGSSKLKEGDIRVAEYDRKEQTIQIDYVKPRDKVGGYDIPALVDVPAMSLDKRKALLFASLGFQTEYVDNDQSLPESSLVILCIISHWVRYSQPKVNDSHVRSVIFCIFVLHLNSLDFAQKSPSSSMFLSDIIDSLRNISVAETKMNYIKSRMRKFLNKHGEFPSGSSLDVIHGFAQLQTTFIFAIHLNQVLLNPVEIPSPTVILNGSFLHSFCRFLEGRAHAENYLKALLRECPPLERLICDWKEKVKTLSSAAAGMKTVYLCRKMQCS